MTQKYYYTNVVAKETQALFLPAGILAAPDAASSVILGRFADGWGRHNVQHDLLVSATYLAALNRFYFLGKYGLIKTIGGKGLQWTLANVRGRFEEALITESRATAPLECIRTIDDQLYACGWNGQIYVSSGGTWQQIETKKIADKANFITVVGINARDIYAAGMGGIILHYDGTKWSRVDSPTNAHFYCSTVLNSAQVLLAGANGGVYLGNAAGFKFVGSNEVTENFWSAAEFKGTIYLTASKNSIWTLSATGPAPMSLNVEGDVTTYRLFATQERLFSAGAYDLLEFDGSSWSRIDCSENR